MRKTAMDELIAYCAKSAKKTQGANDDYSKGFNLALQVISQKCIELKKTTEKGELTRAYQMGLKTNNPMSQIALNVESDTFYTNEYVKK